MNVRPPTGLHHVTAIAGDPVENLRFYQGVMGLRLVKKSVNQDDPATYHLFYADGEGHPGTDLTFFPWAHAKPGTPGVGVVQETYLTVPPGTLEAWASRLLAAGARVDPITRRFGERTLPSTARCPPPSRCAASTAPARRCARSRRASAS